MPTTEQNRIQELEAQIQALQPRTPAERARYEARLAEARNEKLEADVRAATDIERARMFQAMPGLKILQITSSCGGVEAVARMARAADAATRAQILATYPNRAELQVAMVDDDQLPVWIRIERPAMVDNQRSRGNFLTMARPITADQARELHAAGLGGSVTCREVHTGARVQADQEYTYSGLNMYEWPHFDEPEARYLVRLSVDKDLQAESVRGRYIKIRKLTADEVRIKLRTPERS